MESSEKHDIDALEMDLFKKVLSKMIENELNNEINHSFDSDSSEEDDLSRVSHERAMRALLRAGRALPRLFIVYFKFINLKAYLIYLKKNRAGRALPRYFF